MRLLRPVRTGFTLIEIVIAVAIVAILAAAISPLVFRHLQDGKIGRAQGEAQTIATAILTYYKDVGRWPYTSQNGPTGNAIARLVSGPRVASGSGPQAQSRAGRWGSYGPFKHLGDYLYFNNADDNSSVTGQNAGEQGQDWPTQGRGAWRGPYVERYALEDPWGNAYVVNARYLPGGGYAGNVRHHVFVLSAGPNGRWETAFDDAVAETIAGDDIGVIVSLR